MRFAILVILLLALSGCTSKDKMSQDEMAARAESALVQLPIDLAAGGALSGAALSLPVDAGFGIITVPMDLEIGSSGEFLLTGSFGNPLAGTNLEVTIFCSATEVVVITDGLPSLDSDLDDYNAKSRNPLGTCTEGDPDSLGAFAGLTRLLDVGTLEAKQYKQIGKHHFEATFRDAEADLVIEVKGTQVQRVAAISGEGELSAVLAYGERRAIDAPEAADLLALPVDWSGRAMNDGFQLNVHEGYGPVDDYAIRVYDKSASVSCNGGPAPVVAFALADGANQEQAGFILTFVDDGDDILGEGDWAWLEHPDRLQNPWTYKVEVWDEWADASADPFCSVPGVHPGIAFAGIGLVGLLVRRFQMRA